MRKRLQKFYAHPTMGLDNNGNGGPTPDDEGWIEFEAYDYNDAVKKLPAKMQAKIRKAMKEYQKGRDRDEFYDDVSNMIAETCAWGFDWTLMCEEAYASSFGDEFEVPDLPQLSEDASAKDVEYHDFTFGHPEGPIIYIVYGREHYDGQTVATKFDIFLEKEDAIQCVVDLINMNRDPQEELKERVWFVAKECITKKYDGKFGSRR